mmetsp:Transcript_18049/g.51228  ORF Transcript_18049/g.51228 Transcript_18049/m.51228 type:complete len:239 (+) Transcript_18049:1043-1759(+)
MIAHGVGKRRSGPEGQKLSGAQEARAHAALQRERAEVDEILPRQAQRRAAEVAVELAKGHETSGQGHAADEVAQDASSVVQVQARYGVRLVGRDGCDHGCQADQGVEGSHGLWQRDGLYLHAKGGAQDGTAAQQTGGRSVRLGRHAQHCGCQASGHTADAQLDAHLSSCHARETTDGTNAKELRNNAGAVHGRKAGQGSSHQSQSRNGEESRVVLIARTLEQVKHPLRHDEPSNDIHG